MAKYSFGFKKKVVMSYLNGEGGLPYIAKKYNIPSWASVKKWVRNYESFGDEGLMPSRRYLSYPFEYKLGVVELYLSSELSYQELALQEGIYNPGLIHKWVKGFRTAGPDALRPRKKGRKKTLSTSDSKTQNKPVDESSVNTSAERVKELEEELLKLRIENAFLKELRRLRLEDEAKMRERRSSSTASEENSN